MKTLYLDIFSGIAGDMFIGAALDLGVDPAALEAELKKLGLDFHLHWARASRGGVSGVKFDVHTDDHHHGEEHDHHPAGGHRPVPGHHHHEDEHGHEPDHDHDDHASGHTHTQTHEGHAHHDHHHPAETHHHDKPLNPQPSTLNHQPIHGRSFSQIRSLIAQSALSPWVRSRSIAVFERIARAEGKVHGIPASDVHFHEVGAIDSIVDVVGACVALELLGNPRVRAGAIVEGTGWVDCAHGRYPLPVMATLEILRERGVPVTQCEEPHELVTPTGAALLAEWVESFGPLEDFVAEKIGYGLGTRENRRRPNVLRAVLGEAGRGGAGDRYDWESDRVVVLETNLDDHQPETLGYLVDKALQEGALDVFYTPAQMKKNRPGVLLGLLCAEGDADRLTELIFHETTALGVRRSVTERKKLRREFVVVPTEFGDVRVKIGKLNGRTLQIAPEFESCRAIAAATGQPLKNLYRAAQQAAARL